MVVLCTPEMATAPTCFCSHHIDPVPETKSAHTRLREVGRFLMCEGMSFDGPFLRWQQVLCEEGKILAVFTGFLHHCSDGESYDSFSSPVLSLRSNPRVLNIEWPVSSWQFGDGCRSDP